MVQQHAQCLAEGEQAVTYVNFAVHSNICHRAWYSVCLFRRPRLLERHPPDVIPHTVTSGNRPYTQLSMVEQISKVTAPAFTALALQGAQPRHNRKTAVVGNTRQ